MHLSSLCLLTIILLIILNIVSTSGKSVKTTTRIVPRKTKILAIIKIPRSKQVRTSKIIRKKKKKVRQTPWKIPNIDPKQVFNDYKTMLHSKIRPRKPNITTTAYQLVPVKYSSQITDKNMLRHYIIKLPDYKYAHVIIGTTKYIKIGVLNDKNSISIDNHQTAKTL